MNKHGTVRWWQCYLIWGAMAALLSWDYWPQRVTGWHHLLAAVIILAGHGLLALWLHRNAEALAQEDEERRTRTSSARRDVPLTLAQARYLAAMERREHAHRDRA